MNKNRLSADKWLEHVQRTEQTERRGKLKIFFGACAGVGKTYAMLMAAHAKKAEGIDVVIGIIETHGRQETIELVKNLEVLPLKDISYKENILKEFDIHLLLTRKPQLVLIDEFAHSNVQGSLHPKRWQDIEEILSAGIDVYSTLNVQHLASLNDIVGRITGIIVHETIPDRLFDEAHEVTLVDIPPDDLLARLKAGKIYLAQQAAQAIENFFRKGNLLALRELALRRTADRVNKQVREYRHDQAILPTWDTKERLLVCIGIHTPEKLIRNASRLVMNLKAEWIVIYVETPTLSRLPTIQRDRILKMLRLAEELGAQTSILAGTSLLTTILDYAKSYNISRIILGKSKNRPWYQKYKPHLSDQISYAANDIDIFIISYDTNNKNVLNNQKLENSLGLIFENVDTPQPLKNYGYALLACTGITFIASALMRYFDLANVIMLFLVSVILTAIHLGRGPSIFASIISVLAFDFFFVPPRFSFSVTDTQYVFTFILMLAVSILISQLAAKLRYEAKIATYRERRTHALYKLGQLLGGALTQAQIIEIATDQLTPLFQAHLVFYLPNSQNQLQIFIQDISDPPELGTAQWVFDHQQEAGLGTKTLPSSLWLFIPLNAPMCPRGVLAIRPFHKNEIRQIFIPEQRRLLETCASQIALALERVHYVEVAQDAVLSMESERLRNNILATVSHDLKTPITSLIGLSDLLGHTPLGTNQFQETVKLIQNEAVRINHIIINLLDMARLQSGVHLRKEWMMFDEVIGSALNETQQTLKNHSIQLLIPRNLPAIEIDGVLIERVLVNLLENAAKYTPSGSTVTLSVCFNEKQLIVDISDTGPGLPSGLEHKIFEKFTRGISESNTSGVGLGLAICRTIIEAHQGTISAHNIKPHGAKFSFILPMTSPPTLPLSE